MATMRRLDERWGQSQLGRAAQNQPDTRLRALLIDTLEAELAASSGALLRTLAALDAHRAEAEALLDEAKRAEEAVRRELQAELDRRHSVEAQLLEREGMLVATTAQLHKTHARLATVEDRLVAVVARLSQSDHRIALLQRSTSWRITAPLRLLAARLPPLRAANGCRRRIAGWLRRGR